MKKLIFTEVNDYMQNAAIGKKVVGQRGCQQECESSERIRKKTQGEMPVTLW